MQIGKKKKTKHYPNRIPRRKAIPAPGIFTPKKVPVKIPVKTPAKVD
jgi:hypothetical protein